MVSSVGVTVPVILPLLTVQVTDPRTLPVVVAVRSKWIGFPLVGSPVMSAENVTV